MSLAVVGRLAAADSLRCCSRHYDALAGSGAEPEVVLGHVQVALETVTAAAQLSSSIQTLALCVRPLLIAGLRPTPLASLPGTQEEADVGGGTAVTNGSEVSGGGFGLSLGVLLSRWEEDVAGCRMGVGGEWEGGVGWDWVGGLGTAADASRLRLGHAGRGGRQSAHRGCQ